MAWQPPNPVVDTGSKGCRQAEEGVLSGTCHVGLWDSPDDAVDRYRQAKQATQPGRPVLEAKTRVWEELGGRGKAPGVDEIRPEYLKSLDVVGLSWLTRLCNIAWRLGTVPLEWQTGVVVPLFKKGDRRVCSNYRGITLLSLPGKVSTPGYWRGELQADSRPSDSGGTMHGA
ncbi:hypothetical protein L3Q82_011023 [Scortum barcoo]|uniref:Uncharacterized protein n=1 Tax=Scortum barcoo TaxID=214431 RepID=A0ACB8W8Y9_9TELE|nr:hypothetical protein L3Q82_011023 [Scortum barcoo]